MAACAAAAVDGRTLQAWGAALRAIWAARIVQVMRVSSPSCVRLHLTWQAGLHLGWLSVAFARMPLCSEKDVPVLR